LAGQIIAPSPKHTHSRTQRRCTRFQRSHRRIQAVAADVESRADLYATIPEFELAELLGIVEPHILAASGTKWEYLYYSPRVSLEEHFDNGSYEFDMMLEHLPVNSAPNRSKELLDAFSAKEEKAEPPFKLLKPEERETIETALQAAEMENLQSNGMNCLAHVEVTSPSGESLRFEAVVEDDGQCETLRTPYDERDGRFVDLTECLLSYW